MIIVQNSVRLADPHICTDNRDRLSILDALFDALVRRDPRGRYVAGLAKRWSVASDARTFEFQLRDGVQFHDGRALDARDVVASIERATAPEIGGELGTEGVWASYLGDARLTTQGARTVRLRTARPMADLLDLLVDIPILPRDTAFALNTTPVGTGPYRLADTGDGVVEMRAFERSGTRRPAFERVRWEAVPADQARLAAVQSRRATLASGLGPVAARHAASAGLTVVRRPATVCVAFLFNARAGAGADRRVRQAVNHAVDVRRMIRECLHDGAERLNGPLTRAHLGCDTSLPPYPYDPDRARALLAEVGAPVTLTVDVPQRLPDEAPRLGALLAQDLERVGIAVTVREFADRPAYAEQVKAGAIGDLACFDSSPASTYRVLREKLDSSVAGPWWQGYHSAAVNTLLASAAETVDDAQRRRVYREAYGLLRADAPWLFLYHPTLGWCTGADSAAPSIGATGLVDLTHP